MNTVTAEAIPQSRLDPEEYAHSVANLIKWGGALACERAVGAAETGLEKQNYADYASGLREMLRTDSEFSRVLDLDDRREHAIVDGRAVSETGQAMVDMVAEGRRGSEKLAADYEEWGPQARRDASDEIIARRADALSPGQALFAISPNPNQALQKYPDLYKRLGYRDISYIQYYAKTPDGRMTAGSYSVDTSDLKVLSQLLRQRGVEVPADADEDTFIQHSFELTAAPDEAERVVRDMRRDCYDELGADHQRHNVSEYLAHNEATARKFFDTYYPSLAKAANSRRNNEVMQSLALTLLDARIDKLKPVIRQRLIKVANAEDFDYASAKVMESVIRYAVVEELRKGLDAQINGAPAEQYLPPNIETESAALPGFNLVMMNQMMAGNVSAGVEAERDYGGCPGQVELSDKDESGISSFDSLGEPQANYGGRGRGRRTKLDDGDCEFTSKKCPECGKRDVKTTVTRVRGRKHVEGGCGCSKTY